MANVGFPESTGIGEMYQNLSKETKFLIPDKVSKGIYSVHDVFLS